MESLASALFKWVVLYFSGIQNGLLEQLLCVPPDGVQEPGAPIALPEDG